MNSHFSIFKKPAGVSNTTYTKKPVERNTRSFSLARSSYRPQARTLGNNFTQNSRGIGAPPVKRPRGCRSCGGAV